VLAGIPGEALRRCAAGLRQEVALRRADGGDARNPFKPR
jgi:hypothetical protein